MLYRFFDPQSGRILVNGQDISGVDIDNLRKVIGIVPQVGVYINNLGKVIGIVPQVGVYVNNIG